MRWRFILKIIGALAWFEALAMLIALGVGLYFHDRSVLAFLEALSITALIGLLFYFSGRSDDAHAMISQREGMAIVTLGWIAVGIFGALPFYLGGEIPVFTDALFESVSGFTTTGSSVLDNIEGLSKGMLFWRSLIQWLGGMGIIVLSVAILPFLGVGGMQLYKAEVPSPVVDKLRPRISDTAKILWKVYLLFTVVEIILLVSGGMSFYDAVCHSLTTMPTGGFSPKNTSIAHYHSIYFDIVIIIFMVLAGINFSLHYQMLRGKPLAFWRDSECRFFLGVTAGFILLISLNIYGEIYATIGDALRFASFQVASIITTTGYATADYELWPAMSQILLLFCMILGASAGSTGGGVKCLRVLLCIKFCYKELFTLIHPHAVTRIKIGGKPVEDDVMQSIMGFLALYMGLFAFSTVLISAMGVDWLTSFGAVAATIGNIGPGFGLVGPTENFGALPYMVKWVLIACMLIGRLEIFTVIILLAPEFWRK